MRATIALVVLAVLGVPLVPSSALDGDKLAEDQRDVRAAVELAKEWNAGDKQGTDLSYEIKLLDVSDITAAAMVKAKWGQDYFHLVKEKDRWRIHHVLWQSHPPEGR